MTISKKIVAPPSRDAEQANSDGSKSILLVDTNAVMRAGLAAVLMPLDARWTLHEACSGRQAQEILRDERIDLVVLDALIHDEDVMETVADVRKAHPGVRILVIYSALSRFEVMQLLRAGADGLVPRDCEIEALIQAVRTTINGNSCYLPGAVIAQLFRDPVSDGAGTAGLTARETDVLLWVAKGFSNSQIAQQLGLGIRTVETHRFNLRKKTGISRVSDLHKLARRLGLISSDLKRAAD